MITNPYMESCTSESDNAFSGSSYPKQRASEPTLQTAKARCCKLQNLLELVCDRYDGGPIPRLSRPAHTHQIPQPIWEVASMTRIMVGFGGTLIFYHLESNLPLAVSVAERECIRIRLHELPSICGFL